MFFVCYALYDCVIWYMVDWMIHSVLIGSILTLWLKRWINQRSKFPVSFLYPVHCFFHYCRHEAYFGVELNFYSRFISVIHLNWLDRITVASHLSWTALDRQLCPYNLKKHIPRPARLTGWHDNCPGRLLESIFGQKHNASLDYLYELTAL